MRRSETFFVCLSIFLSFSASASDLFKCSPFVGVGFSQMLTGAYSIGDLHEKLEKTGSTSVNSEQIDLVVEGEPSLYTSSSKIPLKLVGQTTRILTPLKFFKTLSPVSNKDLAGLADNLLTDVYNLDGSPITNIVAVVAENYAVLLPETGSAISVCKKSALEYSEHGAQDALERLQQAMISSDLLRETLPEQFDRGLFPYFQDLLKTTGLYDLNNSLISGIDVRTVGATLVVATVTLQTLRMLTLALTKNPELAAVVFPTPDRGITIDVNALSVTSAQLNVFLKQNGSTQRNRCTYDASVKKLCSALEKINFQIAYAQGNAT